MQWGAESLSMYLREGVKQYPIDGIYRLSEIPEPPVMTLWQGWPEWESKLKDFANVPEHHVRLAWTR